MTIQEADRQPLEKCPSGIVGFDEITGGGLARGRPALVCGGAGCGKTLFGIEFLVRGARQYGEPGVFMTFEETAPELARNVRALGFDLDRLVAEQKLAVDYVHVERSEIEETGEYDLEGLFIRLGLAIDSLGAKRVVLDTLETLFAGLSNQAILRAELRRLFRWLKDKGVTAVITAERGDGALTRHGLEEYVSDCVIVLDHRVHEQVATRRLRVVKYHGSGHGTNEYPFLIGEHGLDVLPIISLGLNHAASSERISSGLPRLDTMLGGQGYYRGSSVLVSGTAGTGKSSVAATFIDAACRRGEKALYFAFEEAPSQITRNMRSIGIDLEPHVARGLLQFHAARPTLHGRETHLATMYKAIRVKRPRRRADRLGPARPGGPRPRRHPGPRAGLGIGLSLVKGLVELHGGTIAVRSAGLGQGSEFTIRLPEVLDQPPSGARPASLAARRPVAPPCRILIADDRKANAHSMALLLEELGHEVRMALGGAEAVQVAEAFRPAVVVLDLGMPEVDGCEAARRIRRQPWGRAMTLAALTGWAGEEERRRSREAGFDHHLVKPVGAATLSALLPGARVSPIPRPSA